MNKIPENTAKVITDDLRAVAEWMTGPDTGTCAQYLPAVALCGQTLKSRWGDVATSDSVDFGQCVNLIKKVPSVRGCFPVMRGASAAYIDHWDELVAMLAEGDCPAVTSRLREPRSAAREFTFDLR